MKKIFFLGRFQPFHLGHLDALLKVKGEKIVIGIGSTNKKDQKNPYSYTKRKKLIDGILKEFKIKAKIIALPDLKTDEEWMSFVIKKISKDYIIYSGNKDTIDLFRNYGYKTKRVKIYRGISGTLIRGLMKENKEWRFLVPSLVSKRLK